MALQPRIHLFTTQLVSSQERLEGLATSILANSSETAVELIFVLAEGLNPSLGKDLEARYPKLRLLPCTERPDFSILIQAAIDHGDPDAITIICNSDIWFDLQHSDPASVLRALHGNPCLVLTLTRRQDHQPEQLLSVDGILPEFLSSDAWIFAGIPRPFPCRGIYLGIQDMERLVHRTLQMEGYILANAGSWVRGIHLESSANNYSNYNHDWLQQTTFANPLLAASGLPPARLILPPCHGAFAPTDFAAPERFTPLWDEFIQRWILVDLSQASSAECKLSVLWLLFLVVNHNRYLMAYIDDLTDPDIVQLLDRCHRLTGRSLCLRGFAMNQLLQDPPAGDLCWVSSPAVIGPELLHHHLPVICLSSKSPRPIKRSWLRYYHNPKGLLVQLQALEPIDPAGVKELALSFNRHINNILPNFLAATLERCSATAAYWMALLRKSPHADSELQERRRSIANLSKRPGYILHLKNDPGPQLLTMLKRWMRRLKGS